MSYIIGIDGGGTKTECVLADGKGNIVDIAYGGCSNHQICGIKQATGVISALVNGLMVKHGIIGDDVASIFMGLAGADSQSDINLLTRSLSMSFKHCRLEVVTDIWITFASEVTDGWGAITICGTGHNCAVSKPDGEKIGIMALKYTLGNYGGGRHIADKALHAAFRCGEHTGPYTALTGEILKLCGTKTLEELASAVYKSGYTFHYDFEIPKLVFRLAEDGDQVARHIMRRMGEEMATMLSGLIMKAGLQDRDVNVVLGGSLLNKQDSAFIVECYCGRLKESVPKFNVHIAKKPPVLGALFMAFRSIGLNVDKMLIDKMFRQIERMR